MNEETDDEKVPDGLKSLKEALQHARDLELPDVDEDIDQEIEQFFESKIDETNGRKL